MQHDGNKTFEEISVFAEKYLSLNLVMAFHYCHHVFADLWLNLRTTLVTTGKLFFSKALELSVWPFCEKYGISHAWDVVECMWFFNSCWWKFLMVCGENFKVLIRNKSEWVHVQFCPSLKTCKNMKYRITKLCKHCTILFTCLLKPDGQINLAMFMNERFNKELQTLNNASTSSTPQLS